MTETGVPGLDPRWAISIESRKTNSFTNNDKSAQAFRTSASSSKASRVLLLGQGEFAKAFYVLCTRKKVTGRHAGGAGLEIVRAIVTAAKKRSRSDLKKVEGDMLERTLKRTRGEVGQGIIAIVVSLAIFAVSGILLYRTFDIANTITKQADSIEENAISINSSASSIAQLVKTEAILDSILTTSEPLVPSLDEIIAVAESIDGTATSIENTILGINSNSRAIGAEINRILGTSTTISSDISQINKLLDPTISALDSIDTDLSRTAVSLASANVSVCGIGSVALGIIVNSQPDETCSL